MAENAGKRPQFVGKRHFDENRVMRPVSSIHEHLAAATQMGQCCPVKTLARQTRHYRICG
jgi:hypothetical protein